LLRRGVARGQLTLEPYERKVQRKGEGLFRTSRRKEPVATSPEGGLYGKKRGATCSAMKKKGLIKRGGCLKESLGGGEKIENGSPGGVCSKEDTRISGRGGSGGKTWD